MTTRFIKFKKPPVNDEAISVGIGPFNRSFAPAAQPFEVTESDWQFLKTHGDFEIDVEAETAAKQKAEANSQKEVEKPAKKADKN